MKKTLLNVLFILSFAFNCIAQDTVQYLDPYYLFNERHPYSVLPMPQFAVWGNWDNLCAYPNSATLDRSSLYHTPNNQEPVLVYGIAVTAAGRPVSYPHSDLFMNWYETIDESEISKYPYEVILSKAMNDSLNIIASKSWDDETDIMAYFRYSMIGGSQLYEHVVHVFEYYFETPVLVYDTFYVGYRRMESNSPYVVNLVQSIDSMTSYWVVNDNINSDDDHLEYIWGGAFPIIQPNRHCRVPAAPSLVVYSSTNTVRFTLPYAAGDSLVLSIAGYGQPADSGTIYPVTDSIMDIVIPDSGRYTARLMRICQRYGGVMLQSDWSAPTHFFIVNNLAIGQPSDIGVSIVPNPATDAVTVSADATLLTLELRDLLGRTVLTQQPASTKTTLDVSTLPAGTYILRLHTPQGVATKKLVVSR